MDAARSLATDEIVEAEDLKLLGHVDRYGYVCHGQECGIQVFPRSYRVENLLRAHFFTRSTHTSNCDVAGEDEVRSRGKKVSVAEELKTSPGLSPSRLTLLDERVTVDALAPPSGNQSVGQSRAAATEDESRKRPIGRRPANSIRPICRAFLQFPYDRHLPLHVDGIQTTTYQTVFKKLRSEGIELFSQQRIFYAELAWQAAEEVGENLAIPLNAGEWKAKELRPYRVIVRWALWSQTAKTRLRNELEVARRENIEAKKSKVAQRTYAFFIGQQNSENSSQFFVDDLRLICTVHGALVFP